MLRIHGVTLLLVALAAASAGAQTQDLYELWRWTHFGEQDGIPLGQVRHLTQTSDSTLWAATFDGIAWFDGYQWQTREGDSALPTGFPAVSSTSRVTP